MITARDIISGRFVRIGDMHSAAEALGVVFDPEEDALRDIVIVVFDSGGNYQGIVEPRRIFESLGTELSLAGEDPAGQIAAIRRGLSVPVGEIARRDIPAAMLGDNLASLLLLAARTEADTLPVFDKQQFVGVIPIGAIFSAVCKITISAAGEELPFQGRNP